MGADNAEAGRILPGFIKSIPFLLYTVALAQPSPPGGPSKASPSPICWPTFPAPIPTRAAFPPGSKNSHRTSQLHKYYMNEVFVPQHMDEPHHYGGFVHTAHTPGRPPTLHMASPSLWQPLQTRSPTAESMARAVMPLFSLDLSLYVYKPSMESSCAIHGGPKKSCPQLSISFSR